MCTMKLALVRAPRVKHSMVAATVSGHLPKSSALSTTRMAPCCLPGRRRARVLWSGGMAYQLVHFGPGHFGDYLAFARRFRREPGPTAGDLHHKWRIFDNPLGGHLMFAHTDDEIAASLCISGRRLAAPDGPLPGYELGDGWTHERHQRRGLFFRLGGLARELAFADPAA